MIILSSPLGFSGCTISFEEIPFPQSLAGYQSFVGHPATKELLETLGATTTSGKWEGPKIGETYLAVPLASPTSREAGYTKDAAIQSIQQLKAILCTRIA